MAFLSTQRTRRSTIHIYMYTKQLTGLSNTSLFKPRPCPRSAAGFLTVGRWVGRVIPFRQITASPPRRRSYSPGRLRTAYNTLAAAKGPAQKAQAFFASRRKESVGGGGVSIAAESRRGRWLTCQLRDTRRATIPVSPPYRYSGQPKERRRPGGNQCVRVHRS